MKLIETKFSIEDVVYLVTDKDQVPRIITGLIIRSTGILYEVSGPAGCDWRYEFEISSERNVLVSF